MRLVTPKRLKEDEDFVWALADRLIDGFHGSGPCSIERLLDRLGDVRLSEAEPLEYQQSFLLRGMRALHLDFSPIA